VADITVINQSLDALDLKKISEYTRKLSDIGDGFNKMMAHVYLRDFIIAYDISTVMFAKSIQTEMQAKSHLEEVEAIAFLDKSSEFFKLRNEKATVESRKAFVDLDPDVKQAKETLARATATVALLKGKVQEFREAIGAVKLLQNDGYTSQWEGMK
jgi:hypothetical protein